METSLACCAPRARSSGLFCQPARTLLLARSRHGGRRARNLRRHAALASLLPPVFNTPVQSAAPSNPAAAEATAAASTPTTFLPQADTAVAPSDDLSNWREWLKGPEEVASTSSSSIENSLNTSTSAVALTAQLQPLVPDAALADQAASTSLLPDWLDAATQTPQVPVRSTARSMLSDWLHRPPTPPAASSSGPALSLSPPEPPVAANASFATDTLTQASPLPAAPTGARVASTTADTPALPDWLQPFNSSINSAGAVTEGQAASSSSTSWASWLPATAAEDGPAAAAAGTTGAAGSDASTNVLGGNLSDWLSTPVDKAASHAAGAAADAGHTLTRSPLMGWLQGATAESAAAAAAPSTAAAAAAVPDVVPAAATEAAAAPATATAETAADAAQDVMEQLGNSLQLSAKVQLHKMEMPHLDLPAIAGRFKLPPLPEAPQLDLMDRVKALPFKMPAVSGEFKMPEMPQLPAVSTDFKLPALPEMPQLQLPDHMPSLSLPADLPGFPDISLPTAAAGAGVFGALQGVPVGEVAGVVGLLLGALAVALYGLERDARQKLEGELKELQDAVAAKEEHLQQVQLALQEEQKAREEAESWLPRLKEAERDIFKLERALELKDGQLETFITTAHRQIKLLEQRIRDQQKMTR